MNGTEFALFLVYLVYLNIEGTKGIAVNGRSNIYQGSASFTSTIHDLSCVREDAKK